MTKFNIATYILAAVGAVVVLLILYCWAKSAIKGIAYTIRKRKRKRISHDEAIKIAYQIDQLHYWFSSSTQVFNCLFIVQYYLKNGDRLDYEEIRSMVQELGDTRYCDLSTEKFNHWLNEF